MNAPTKWFEGNISKVHPCHILMLKNLQRIYKMYILRTNETYFEKGSLLFYKPLKIIYKINYVAFSYCRPAIISARIKNNCCMLFPH